MVAGRGKLGCRFVLGLLSLTVTANAAPSAFKVAPRPAWVQAVAVPDAAAPSERAREDKVRPACEESMVRFGGRQLLVVKARCAACEEHATRYFTVPDGAAH